MFLLFFLSVNVVLRLSYLQMLSHVVFIPQMANKLKLNFNKNIVQKCFFMTHDHFTIEFELQNQLRKLFPKSLSWRKS